MSARGRVRTTQSTTTGTVYPQRELEASFDPPAVRRPIQKVLYQYKQWAHQAGRMAWFPGLSLRFLRALRALKGEVQIHISQEDGVATVSVLAVRSRVRPVSGECPEPHR